MANGAGLSISHIGHSRLPGSSLKLCNILHVPHISQHLLSAYRLLCDNDVFVEFHRRFFLVKDKATRRIILQGSSRGGGGGGCHLHCLTVPPPVFEFRRRNGINVLVILQIMWSLPLFGVMNFRVLVQIIHR